MDVDYLSFSPQFFLRLNRETIVFGHDKLPNQLHLTCSFDNRSKDGNFHVTKENGKRRKPKVTVALTKKINLEKSTIVDPFQLFNNIYEPLNLCKWRRRRRLHKNNRAEYIRLDNFAENKSADLLLKELEKIFWQHTTIVKKTKLKVQQSILPALENWSKSELAGDFFWENLRPVSKYLFGELETGFWISEMYTGPVLVWKSCVYKPKDAISGEGFLKCFFDEQTVSDLIEKFESAISIVARSEDYSETEHADVGIRIWE